MKVAQERQAPPWGPVAPLALAALPDLLVHLVPVEKVADPPATRTAMAGAGAGAATTAPAEATRMTPILLPRLVLPQAVPVLRTGAQATGRRRRTRWRRRPLLARALLTAPRRATRTAPRTTAPVGPRRTPDRWGSSRSRGPSAPRPWTPHFRPSRARTPRLAQRSPRSLQSLRRTTSTSQFLTIQSNCRSQLSLDRAPCSRAPTPAGSPLHLPLVWRPTPAVP